MIYLATPYTHPDSDIRSERYRKVTEIAALMVRNGMTVYSPITHSHPMAETGLVKGLCWDTWRDFDLKFLHNCSELWVLMLDGWEESTGVRDETAEALKLGIPVAQFPYEELWERLDGPTEYKAPVTKQRERM